MDRLRAHGPPDVPVERTDVSLPCPPGAVPAGRVPRAPLSMALQGGVPRRDLPCGWFFLLPLVQSLTYMTA